MSKQEGTKLEEVIIRHAVLDDEDNIIQFIKEYWFIRNHVFTRHRELFEQCHIVNGKLCFVIAEGKESKNIYGVLGYCPNNISGVLDISTVIFQTIKSSDPSLGINLFIELLKITDCRVAFSPGAVKRTLGIYQFLGYETGLMKHYYRLNDYDDYKIAVVNQKVIQPVHTEEAYELRRLYDMETIRNLFDFDQYKEVVPYRDEWSVSRRYFENIGYEYQIFGLIDKQDQCQALLVMREILCNKRKMCKVIDYIGEDEALAHCSLSLDKLMKENEYEYIDFYEIGIADSIMERAGFTLRTKEDTNIIPNYFEPFEQRNIDIYYFTTNSQNFHMYRTDSGQDRPNFIEELEGEEDA